jgi:molybdate transport system substrate-binding protein
MNANVFFSRAFLLGLMAQPLGATAAEIKVLSTVGVKPATPEVIAEFERGSGHKVTIMYGLASVLKSKFLEGEAADVVILTAPMIEDLVKQAKVAGGSKADIARSGLGVAVRDGAAKPDISTLDAFKKAMMEAKTVGYSRESASGVGLLRALERLGIAEEVKAKSREASGRTGEMLAAGAFELGVSQIPELLAVSGIQVIGPLPGDLQSVTVFSVGLSTSTKEPDAAKAFIQFLAAPAALAVFKTKGLAS